MLMVIKTQRTSLGEISQTKSDVSELLLIAAQSLRRIRLKDWLGKPIRWRGSQVVRQGSAKALFAGSIPALASKPNCECSKELRRSGSEVGTKVGTKMTTIPVITYHFGVISHNFLTVRSELHYNRKGYEATIPPHPTHRAAQ